MSKYSFIDAELNIPGKQCFCIDINNSNTQFTYANAPAPIPTNTPAPIPTSAPTPITTNVPTLVRTNTNEIMNTNAESNKIDTYSSINNSFLLSPDVKNNIDDREKEIIQTVNNLLKNRVNDLDNKSSIIASNEIISNIPNNSLTVDNDSNVASTIDLNKMATSKKNYKSKSNVDLFENFTQNKCNRTCSIKNKYKKHRKDRKYIKHTKKGKSLLDNDNIIIIIIILLLAYSYFQNKK
jgi:hypothetical protein